MKYIMIAFLVLFSTVANAKVKDYGCEIPWRESPNEETIEFYLDRYLDYSLIGFVFFVASIPALEPPAFTDPFLCILNFSSLSFTSAAFLKSSDWTADKSSSFKLNPMMKLPCCLLEFSMFSVNVLREPKLKMKHKRLSVLVNS